MNCWICGQKGSTGEHLVKASDLKDHFGPVSQQTPLYFHTPKKRNIPIGSIKNDRLKSGALLCADCNNRRTQKHDKAWEKLSAYLRANWADIKLGGKFDFSDVFPGSERKSLIAVHLYFVKIFGCMVVEHKVPLDINEFRNSIIHKQPHPNIYLGFGPLNSSGDVRKVAGLTPINAVNLDERSVFASFLYLMNDFSVNVIYNSVDNNQNVLKNTWHPKRKGTCVKLKKYPTQAYEKCTST